MKRETTSSRSELTVAVVAGSVALAGIAVASGAFGSLARDRRDARQAPEQTTGPADSRIPEAPACQQGKVTDPVIVSTYDGSTVRLTETCYYAPAGEPFVVVFQNRVVGLDGNGLYANLSIYARQDDAVSGSPDGKVVSGLRPLFRGDAGRAPQVLSYEVPALAAGTYYLQPDYSPTRLYATLIVA